MRLRTIGPRLAALDIGRIPAAKKVVDSYYLSDGWKALRSAAITRRPGFFMFRTICHVPLC